MAKLGAEPFFFAGGEEGVLLIHGYTGAPGEMRLLGEFLHRKGYTVLGVLLPGHCTTPKNLSKYTFDDWYAEVGLCGRAFNGRAADAAGSGRA